MGTLHFSDLDCYINGWIFVFFAINQRRNGNRTQNIDIFPFFLDISRFLGVRQWWIAEEEGEDPLVEGENQLKLFCRFLGVCIR